VTEDELYDEERMWEFYNDQIIEGQSSCCFSPVLIPDICTKCKEHCEVEQTERIKLFENIL
jgi:hypothetical protein